MSTDREPKQTGGWNPPPKFWHMTEEDVKLYDRIKCNEARRRARSQELFGHTGAHIPSINHMTQIWLPEQHDQHCPARYGGRCANEPGCIGSTDEGITMLAKISIDHKATEFEIHEFLSYNNVQPAPVPELLEKPELYFKQLSECSKAWKINERCVIASMILGKPIFDSIDDVHMIYAESDEGYEDASYIFDTKYVTIYVMGGRFDIPALDDRLEAIRALDRIKENEFDLEEAFLYIYAAILELKKNGVFGNINFFCKHHNLSSEVREQLIMLERQHLKTLSNILVGSSGGE